MFDPGEPYHGPELRAALARLVAEGGGFLDGLPAAVFFAPQGDRWSPAEHVRHLRKSSAALATALRLPRLVIRLRFGTRSGESRRFNALRDTYRAALAAGGQAGRFAPSPEPPPEDPVARRASIMALWREVTAEVSAASSHWSEEKLDRLQLPHPLLGPLSVREMLEFTVYHTSHHLNLVSSRVAGAA